MNSTFESHSSTRVKLGYGLAIALWFASLWLPAAQINGSIRLPGYRVFMIGIDAISAGMPGWFANPVLLAAILAGLSRRLILATWLAAIACVLTLSSFYAPTLARANGVPIEEITFEAGFFLWLAACSVVLATSGYALAQARRAQYRRI